jgi:hypothetical protein
MNEMMGLGACAVVTIIACIPYLDGPTFKEHGVETVFAMIVSALTILIVGIISIATVGVYYKNSRNPDETTTTPSTEESSSFLLFLNQQQQFKVTMYAILALLWILATCMTTFRGPFQITGNGYFAGWCGSVLAVKVLMNAKNSSGTDGI